MKQERVILSFVAVLIGLVVAAVAFFLYQGTKTVNTSKSESLEKESPTQTPKSALFLQIFEPGNEQIVDRKTVTIKGKTDASATIAILTVSSEELIKPSREGDFSTTVQIEDGVNYIKIQAFLPTGESQTAERIVAFTTEEF